MGGGRNYKKHSHTHIPRDVMVQKPNLASLRAKPKSQSYSEIKTSTLHRAEPPPLQRTTDLSTLGGLEASLSSKKPREL